MKNRKNVVIAFLVVAVLCVGIGFAALTDTLNVGGSASIKAEDLSSEFDTKIYFSGADFDLTATGGLTAVANGSKVELSDFVEGSTTKGDKITITVKEGTFKGIGDKLIVTATIHNDSDAYDANVAVSQTNDGTGLTASTDKVLTMTYFEVTIDISNSWKVEKGDTAGVTITIELKNPPPAGDAVVTDSFEFELTATAA